jgi:hypothetical protein
MGKLHILLSGEKLVCSAPSMQRVPDPGSAIGRYWKPENFDERKYEFDEKFRTHFRQIPKELKNPAKPRPRL